MTPPGRFCHALGAACLAVAGLLAGCAGSAPADGPVPPRASPDAQAASADTLAATYAELARQGGRALKLDPAASTVRIVVFRGGKAGKVGHNHVLSAPRFAGFVHLPGDDLAQARFDLAFRLDELEVDAPGLRAALGPAFASQPSADSIAGTREHMLGESNMQADRYPVARVHSLEIVGEAPRLAAKVQVDLHGRSREMWVPLTVEGLPERLTVSGSFVLRQTDFGITPYSVLGGLIAVRDEVVIDFRLVAR